MVSKQKEKDKNITICLVCLVPITVYAEEMCELITFQTREATEGKSTALHLNYAKSTLGYFGNQVCNIVSSNHQKVYKETL